MSGGGCVVGSGGGGAAVATGIVLGTELATSTGPVTGTASEVVIEAETTGSCGSIMEPIVGGLTLKLPSPGCLGIVFQEVSIFHHHKITTYLRGFRSCFQPSSLPW